jgi:hypothetical protein
MEPLVVPKRFDSRNHRQSSLRKVKQHVRGWLNKQDAQRGTAPEKRICKELIPSPDLVPRL